jgi:cobalt-zinc-cadmium efflux system membrane fusion protein
MTDALSLPGELGADPDRLARISSPAAGRIEQVLFREGEQVKKGQVLVVVRVPELARVKSAQASAQARAKAARANAVRLRALLAEQLTVEQPVLDAEAEAHSLEVEAASRTEELGALGAGNVNGYSISLRAPIAGSIVSRNAVVGQPAPADQALGSIADLSELWFLARVFEKDLGKLSAGAEADVHLNAFPDEHFEGKVEYVGQQIDPVARTLNARIRLKNRGEMLRIGLFGTALVSTASSSRSEPKLVVPGSAVSEVGRRTLVFVEHEALSFEPREVTLGAEALGRVEVLGGVKEGERVVSEGTFSLKSLLLKESFAEGGH